REEEILTDQERRPEECYDLIENMTAHHNDWDTSTQRNESSSSNTSSNPKIASLKLQIEEMNRNFTRMLQTNQQAKPPREAYRIGKHTSVSENCSAVILKKLPKKLGDPGKFLIPCGFSELKCKGLADLGDLGKELGLPELISTQMTLELANRDICTPKGIARDVFVLVGKFTFPADFFIVDYESDPCVPLILGGPFLRTARALIDVHEEEIILRDGNERLILNMRNDTSSYSNEPHQESINIIDVYNVSHEEIRDDLFEDIIENLINLDKTKDLPPSHENPLSGSTTYPSPTLISLEENDDMTPEDVIKEVKCLLTQSPLANYSLDNDLVVTILEMFTDEHALDYSSPPLYDDVDDDLYYSSPTLWDDDNIFDLEPVNDDTYNDPFDFKEEKIKESKLLIDELDLPKSNNVLPFPECDSVFYEDFSEVDALPSTNNEDKVFNPGILIHENLFEVTNCATPEKNVKKLTNTSLILEDFNPPLYELPFHKEVPGLGALLLFSSENKEKVFNPGILTSKRVHTSLLPELSHRDSKAFKVIKIFESPMEIFPCSYGEDIRVLDVPCLHFYPP
ncbi:reverse transcriptase domain-containing protein, partial [Tanacetum coccineum]